MTDNFADKLTAARSRIAASLLPKISSAVAASSASKLTATPMGNNLKEHIANGGQATNDMINYFNDKTIADGVNRQNISDAQQNDYYGVSTANLTSSNVFMAAAANAVNLAGGAVGTLAQWGNTLAGDEFTAQAIAMEAGTPAHVLDAYNTLNRTREKKNQLAEQSRVIREQIRNKQGDPIQLNAQLLAIETAYKGIQVDPNVMNTLSVRSGDTTYLEHLDASQELRHKGARVTAGSGEGFMPAMKSSDFSNPYYKKPLEQANKGDQFIIDTNALADRQLDEGTLTGTLQGIGNKVLATGKSIGNVLAAGVDNPMGVLQYTAESAPYFALPGVGTVAIVNQTAVEGRHKFEERTGQALPTTGQNVAMLATDALYGALNYIGDKAVNSAIRGTTAAPVRSSSQVLLDAARGVGSTGLRAAGKEGLAEGAQTYLEESGQNLGTYFNPDTVGQAAAIGAMSSGVVSTPADLKHGVKNYKINKFLNSPMGQEALAQVEKQKVLDAIPLAELQNPTSANHNPVEAINRMTTGVTEATKDTVIKDVSALVNNLQDVVTERETNLANAELRVVEANKNIPIIDQLIASGNTDPALVDARKTYTDYLEGDGSPERIKEQQVAVESATSELINAHEHAKIKLKAVRDAFGVANPNAAAPSVPSINPSTGGTVYPYPSKDAGVRAALESSDVTKNYTPEQREVLRVFSEAVVLIHSTKELTDVSIDIKQGGNTGGQKYRGLEQYMERVVEAINIGNVRSQQYYFRSLAKFSQSHTSKAQKFQEALDAYTPGMVKIVQKNDDTNLWEIMDTVTEDVFNAGNFKKDLRKTGGFGIHNNSAELVAKVQIEADGIVKVLEAIDVMVNGSQSVAPTEPPVAVPATPTPAVPAPVVAPTPPVDTEPSDTTPVDITPVPEAPIQSETPTVNTKGIESLLANGNSVEGIAKNMGVSVAEVQAIKDAMNLEVKDSTTEPKKQTGDAVKAITKALNRGQTPKQIIDGLVAQRKRENKKPLTKDQLTKLTTLVNDTAAALKTEPKKEAVKAATQTQEPTVKVEPSKDTTTAPEPVKQAPETAEGLVKEYGYLGELLADEDVARVVKDVIETVLEVKAGEKRLTSYSRFVGLFAVHGYIEYFTKQAKNDPNIIKLTKAANKLRNLVRLTQHINFLEDYVDSQNNDDLRAYLNKYPELKSIFSELKVKNPTKGTRSLALDVIADFTQVKNLLTTELGKLVQLVGLMYIQAAFEKGQQYLRDTNYADLNEVLSPTVLTLLKGEDIGVLAKNKVLGNDDAFRRNSITDVELTFLDKIDGIPVGELSKEDFETVKALVQNAVNAGFNSYEVVNYTRNEEKISSDIVHNIIVEHLPKEGFTLENFTPEEVIKGAVPQSFIWDFEKKAPETTEDTGKNTTEVVVAPESVVPITPPDSETGDVEIQEDVSSFPEVAEPKEKTTPAGGLSILAGTGSVKDRMKAEQEKAADQILRAGSTIVIDRSKVDKEDGRAWLAKVATTTKEIITTGIQRANLVVASFYQKAKAPSKLVQVKDFAAKVLAMSPTEQAQMLSEALGETATDEQVQFLESFLMFDKSLRGTMDLMAVPSGKDGFRFNDYLQYLYTDIKSETKTVKILNKKTKTLEDVDQVITTGTLDENVKTAISLGIHTFLIEKTGQFYLDHEGVAELLGIKNTKSVPSDVHRMFTSIGNTQPNVVKYLGTKAYQALQLSMDPNVPTQRKESLINALGSLAVQTMMKEGLLQYTRISNDTILNAKAAIKGETNTVNPSKSFTLYLRPTYDTKKTRGKDGWVYETEPKPIPEIEAIKLSAKGNTKVMTALFSVDGRDILPMLKKPTKFTQDTLSKTGNEVPDAIADLVLQMMQKAYNVNGYTYSAMKTLAETEDGLNSLYAMIGVVSDEDIALEHITKRGAIESKNEALKRSVVNGLDFIDSLTTDEDGNFPDYYLPMSVWSVNRVGVTSNLFNEQGDKVHRALTTMTAHKQQVTISPVVDSDNKLTQYGRFLTGVAAYMEGIKINGKTVDKTDGVSFLPGFEAYISTPEFKEVIESVGTIVMGTATAEDIERVQIEVIKLEGGAMSLTSLIALYEASQAKEVEVEIDGVKTKVTQFTTSMSTGSDGVTNGMALSLLMYDAASLSEDFVSAMSWKEKNAFNKASPKAKEAILQAKKDAFDLANPKDTKGMTKAEKDAFNAGGIFFEGDSESSMVAFRRSGKADLYQQLAKVQKDLLQKYVQDNKQNTELLGFIAAMNTIDPTFGTRAGAKVSLVPFVYGSGFRSIGAAQSRAFMEEFYKALTKAKLSKDANKIRQFQANYVALAQAVGTPREEIVDFVKLTVQEALDTELTLKQIKAITGLENKIRSQITEEALTQVAGTLIQSRKRVSGLANVGFESYNRLYRALYDQAYGKLAEGKFLPYRIGTSGSLIGEKIVVEGMSVSQNQKVNDELKDFTPQIYSVGGVFSTNGERSAHSMWSEDQIQDPTDTGTTNPTFGATTEGKALPTPNSDGAIFPSKSITTNLHIRSIKSRGAATNAAVVQAMDAWITAKVSAAMDTFNHHDENVSSIDKAAEMGQLQNKTLFNAVLDYDVYLEVLNGSLLRPLRGIIKLSKRDDTLAIAKGEVGKVMADLRQYMDANFGGFNEDMGMLASLVHEMYSLEIAKLMKYQNLKSISQYGIEGGEYTVTKKDVARINDLIASHVASRTALLKEVAKISADLKVIGAKPKAEPVVAVPEPEKQTSKAEPKKEVSVPVVYSKDGEGSFQGFVGGFSDNGKGTVEGDGKDIAMRKEATSFIGEVSNIKGSSSTHTSASTIAKYTEDRVANAKEDTGKESPTIYTAGDATPRPGNITMLARNGSLKGKPLHPDTKQVIHEAMLAGESFIVGDMPGVDSQFVEFLNEIGANFKIYHTGKSARIQGKDINPNQLDMFAEPETKEETPKGKPASVDSFIVRNEEGVVNVLDTLNSMPINDSTLVGKVIKQVVKALKGKLPANLKVHMLTGKVLPTALDNADVIDSLTNGAPGITYSTGNTHTIGLVEGKADRVTFIHELMHASTVSGLSGTSAEARKLNSNISKLRIAAQTAYRNDTTVLTKLAKEQRDKIFNNAFKNNAEFVAMAMSEPAIIDFLATVPAPKLSAIDTGLISIFSAFIKSVSEFLGLTKNAKGKDVESVLSAMVNQTAQLMNINDQSSASDQVNNYPGQQAAVDAVRLIREYPSKEIFNVLPASLDVGFDTYLSSLMDTIVDKTFNHLSFPTTTYTPLQVWENAITDGRTPYTTRAVAAGFNLSERELFAIETLEVALKGAMDAGITTPVYKEMERAYESARKTLKDESFYNGDWSTALESDREIARNKRKHLFKLEGGQATRSDYMSRFMAMALASSEVNSLLGFPTLTEPRVDGTISSKVLAYYEYAMDWVSGHLTGTMRYQTINSKLPTLAQKLVDIDHKKRDQALSSVYDTVSDNLNKADKYLKESGNALADKLENMIGDSKKGLPSAARTASRVVLRGAAMDMLNVAKVWRDMSAPNTVLGWKGELLNELSDPSSIGQAVRSLLRIHTRLQTERKTHKSTTKESILSNFLDGGKNLSKDDHSAITYGVLRGDLKALYDLHGIRGIEKLLNNADEVDAEVARLEGLITNETHIVRAKDLAHYMTSGEVNLMLAKNALSIARDVGLPTVLDEDMVSEEAVSNIDMLVSLYAIQYMKSSHLQTLQKLFKQEGARTDGNGLAALMKYHQAIEQEAKDTLFEGNSVSIIKGYTPEITNPHREIKIVTLATDAKHLEAMGYQLHSILSADPNDVNQAKRMMYFTEEPSTQRFVTGAMSLTADSSKGTSIIDGSSLSMKDKISALKSITTRSATKLKAKSAKDYDPTAVMNRGISPTYSNLGSIQDFRYEMTHATRDGLLQRNNNFAEIMGTYAGSNFDKASTPKHNETVIDALYKDYKENYLKDPRAYVQIGKDSTDPRAIEMYAMLPYKTRKYIDKVWGKRESMWVRNDALLATFGTNKYSIGEAFEKNPDTRNLVETTIVDMFKVLFGDTAKLRALQGERLNQELVSWFKSTIVIRNLTTLMGNQSANVGVLLVMGVSPVDIIKDSVTAFKAGNRFRKDNTELVRVENNMKANVGNFEDNVQLQARLKDSIARNPLKQFLDAGMLNTIVEDVSLDVEDYNYKSKLAQQLDDQLDKLNPTVRKIGANLVAAPSTELYQVLANATQLSDFTAKYTLYKHLTSKAKDKLSHEDALAMADRMFINYDVPTSKELQYANDMGFLMFTKYTLRIQRAIAYLLKERKASLLAQGMLGTALGMPLATAPVFFLNIGNPFHPGALMVPGALTQPLPIKVLSGGF